MTVVEEKDYIKSTVCNIYFSMYVKISVAFKKICFFFLYLLIKVARFIIPLLHESILLWTLHKFYHHKRTLSHIKRFPTRIYFLSLFTSVIWNISFLTFDRKKYNKKELCRNRYLGYVQLEKRRDFKSEKLVRKWFSTI